MKTNQRGFVGIAIAVIIALALGIGGTYYITHSNKTYRHPSGQYSLSYPSNWTVSEISEGVGFSDQGKGNPNFRDLKHQFLISSVDTDPSLEAKKAADLNHPYVEENVKISGIDAKKIVFKEDASVADLYVIPLNNNKYIVISVSARDSSEEWLSQGNKVLQTFVIDQSKNIIADSQKESAEDDKVIKNLMLGINASAEMYRDTHPNYSGFCNTEEEPARKTFLELKEKLGKQPFHCSDGNTFAASVKLYSGEYYCVDNTGYSGAVTALHDSTSCDRTRETNIETKSQGGHEYIKVDGEYIPKI